MIPFSQRVHLLPDWVVWLWRGVFAKMGNARWMFVGVSLALVGLQAAEPADTQTQPVEKPRYVISQKLTKALPKVIRVGMLSDNEPYCFIGKNGELQGFAVDLLDAVEETMGLHFERVVGTTDVIHQDFYDHKLEMLLSLAPYPERESVADFSVPYLTMSGSIFVNKSTHGIDSLADLRGHKVMVHPGSLGEQVLIRAGMEKSVVHVSSMLEAFRLLDAGENDATLASRLSGLSMIEANGLKHIKVTGAAIPGYEVRYCFAVQNGHSLLLAKLNEGLAVLVRTGEFDRIYNKWFSHIDPPGYSITDLLLAVSAGLALALAVALWALSHQRTLRRRIVSQSDALGKSEARYHGVFDSAIDGLLVLSGNTNHREMKLLEANPSARRLLTLPGDFSGEKRLADFGPRASALMEALVQCLSAHKSEADVPSGYICEETIELASTESPTSWVRLAAVRHGEGYLVVVTDVTEAKMAEENLKRNEEQLHQIQKLEAIGTLSSGIAHDFNNFLTAIVGHAELIRLDVAQGGLADRSVEEILRVASRAGQLVRQILTFSRRTEVKREVVDPSAIVAESVELLRTTIKGRVKFTHNTSPTPLLIQADETQIQQIVLNLCTNAAHAIGQSAGEIEISEELVDLDDTAASQHPPLLAGMYYCLSVRDTGCGMSPDVISRIFEPFYTTKPVGEGTGLGLSVVHGIVRDHGGAVLVTSKPGMGTLFRLMFPVVSDSHSLAPAGTVHEIPRGERRRVLIVDDDAAISGGMANLLRRYDYEVDEFNLPEQAIALFEQEPGTFSLVISDLTMPKIGGLELARRVLQIRPEMPIILMSGYVTVQEKNDALSLGGIILLEKPLSMKTLSLAMEKAMGESAI